MEYGLQNMDNIDNSFLYILNLEILIFISSWNVLIQFENLGWACFHKTLATEVTENIQNEVRSQVTAINEEFK